MASAGLTIAISGSYNGRALEKARQDLQKMKVSAVAELGGAGSSLVDFGSKAAAVGGEIHNMGYKMEQVGSKATRGITLPIAAAALACGKAAVDIDTSLTNVRKTVDGTEQQYRALKDSAIEFSKTNAVSASQIMDIQSLGAQLGFAIDELDEFGRVVSGLDIATNMDAGTAGTELAQFANITKMAHADISRYGSAVVGLGNNMATTEADISAMAMRLAAAGTQAGMSQADILGLAAALSSMGVEAEAGGTAISTIMSQIDKDVATNSASVETWASAAGMSAQAFADAWRSDPVQALTALLSNMERTTAEGGNMSVMLEELGIDSVRQTDIMKRLAGNSELVADAVALSNDEWRKNTALQNEVDNRNSSMAAKLQILQNKVTAVAEEVGTPLANALLEVVDAAEPLIDGVGKAAQAFADMDEKDQKMILGLAAAAAAFGPVTSVAGKLTMGIGDMVVGIGRGAQSLGALKNEISLITSATMAAQGPTMTMGQAVSSLGSKNIPMVTGALGTLKTAMAGVGIGAAIALIGMIVGKLADWYQHEKKVEEATIGLETAMGAARDAYGSYSAGAAECAKSIEDVKSRTDEALDAQGRLAQSMRDRWSDYGTSAALVDAYAAEIQELTGKYDENGTKLSLTADEQERLKLAVEGFNEQTGTSISVTDELNGVLDRSVDSVMASAEAFKEQARQQAAMELYKDVYKQQLEDTMALEDATKALTEADKGLGIWIGDFPVIADEASVAYHDLEKNVEDLTEAQGSAERSMDQLLGVVSGTGKKFESFDAALEQSGVSLSDFGALTDEQLEAIRGGFDGKLSSIVRTCDEKGIAIPQSLAAAINANKGAVAEASEGLGADVDAGIQKGIDDTSDRPKSAIASLGDGLVDTFKSLLGIHSPSTVMAEAGADIDLGLQQGIDGSRSFPESAMASVGQLLQGAVQGLPEWMRQLGSDAGSLLSSGISSLSSAVQSAGGLLSASGQSGAAPLAQGLGSTGTQAGSMLASGLNSLAGYALSAGANLSSSAQSGANPAIGAMGGIGSSAASGFSSAIARASAYQSARNLADTARSGAGSVSAYGAGQNFSRGFASGIGGVSVWSAAYNVGMSALGAIKSALGIASPSKEAAKVGAWFGEGAIVGMRSTEAAIDAESRRMSEAMSLEPAVGAWGYAPKYASAYGAARQVAGPSRQIAFNVTINVAASDVRSAAAIGRSLGDELYLEFARRERAHA